MKKETVKRSKRVSALMREEQSAFVQARTRQYMATLVNLSNSGALVAIVDSEMKEDLGSECHLMFGGAGRMVEIRSKLVRINGCYAAFEFPELAIEDAQDIESKVGRLEQVAEYMAPVLKR